MASTPKPTVPTDAEAHAVLGDFAGLLDVFLERNPDLRPEWKYYGPKNGWSLKVFRGKRNMCFVGSQPGGLGMTFIFGAKAFTQLAAAELRPELRRQVDEARKYPEGHAVRIVLSAESDLADAQLLLRTKQAG